MTNVSPKIICPTCGKTVEKSMVPKEALPFCTKRCKMIDFGKWIGEKYVVEGEYTSDVTKIDDEE
jgi:uncharacterized protein